MSVQPDQTKALCFDLGNTLIEFGPRQIAHQYELLKGALEEMLGPCDGAALKAVRDRQIVAPYSNGYRENDLRECGAELIREIYEVEPEDHQVDALVEARYQAFMDGVEVTGEVLELLRKASDALSLGTALQLPLWAIDSRWSREAWVGGVLCVHRCVRRSGFREAASAPLRTDAGGARVEC